MLYLALLLGAATAIAFDALCRHRDLDPPGFRQPWRRAAATLIWAFFFFAAVWSPLLLPTPPPDVETLHPSMLFGTHALMLGVVAAWLALGWGGHGPEARVRACGLRAEKPLLELGLGLGGGFLAWAGVLAVGMLAALAVFLLGGEDWLQGASETSPWIVYMAGLPILWRLALALSAGVVEEILFRGVLQPRLGILASTLLFAVGHAGYGQIFLFFGVTLLSLIYGLLTWWRGNVWAAIVAHALFDAVQLLVVIPFALEAQRAGVVPPAVAFW